MELFRAISSRKLLSSVAQSRRIAKRFAWSSIPACDSRISNSTARLAALSSSSASVFLSINRNNNGSRTHTPKMVFDNMRFFSIEVNNQQQSGADNMKQNGSIEKCNLLVEEAKQAWNAQEYDRALRCITEANEINEKFMGNPMKLKWREREADMYLSMGKIHHAIPIYKRLISAVQKADTPEIEKGRQVAPLLCKLGEAYNAEGKLDEARKLFFEAIEADSSNSTPYERLGFCLYQMASPMKDKDSAEYKLVMREALNVFTQGIEIEPESAELFYGRGLVHVQMGMLEEAIKDFTAAINVDDRFAAAYFNRAECYQKQELYDRAILDYDNFFNMFHSYCKDMYAKGMNVNAEELLMELLFKRALCYMAIGDFPLAQTDLTQLINMHEEFPVAKDKMSPKYKKYLAMSYNKRGYCAYRRYEWWDCVEYNNKALELEPNMLEAYRDRAEALDSLGRTEEAQRDRERFAVLQREHLWANPQGIKRTPSPSATNKL